MASSRVGIDENGQPLTTHSVWYHSLSGAISFRLQGYYMSATSQARLYGVLGRTPVYETFLCRQVCSHSAQINQFACKFPNLQNFSFVRHYATKHIFLKCALLLSSSEEPVS